MEEALIDADIRKARTLPSSWYSDDSIFQSLISRFTSEWHFANPTPEMKKWNEKYRSALGRMQGSML